MAAATGRLNRPPAQQAAGTAGYAGRAEGVQSQRRCDLRLSHPAVGDLAPFCGATAVTLATGITDTMIRYGDAQEHTGAVQVVVTTGNPRTGQTAPRTSDAATEAMLRSLPGAVHVSASAYVPVQLAGRTSGTDVQFLRGDTATLGYQVLKGRWMTGPDEAVVSPAFPRQHGLTVGRDVAVANLGAQARVTIVGEIMGNDPRIILATRQTLAALAPLTQANEYAIQLAHGTSAQSYADPVKAADPALNPHVNSAVSAGATTVISFAALFTLMLATVAALGVFHTVVLNTRERRRDLGMLKSIGMTPHQVTAMTVTSVAALGTAGGLLGLPLGVLAHRMLIPACIQIPTSMLDVWHAPTLALLALAGTAIAVLGALIPARSAARLTIATVLRNE
ncbi:ABC transporter permease [Streptomyces sp. NPDC005423]|uniref:ABC transporter permease n=1 Tax=Streptomyces sp. NPDC005423 TaxID=3155343 RepID=UPI0033AE7D1A